MRRPSAVIGVIVISGIALAGSAAAAGRPAEIDGGVFGHRLYVHGLDGQPVTATSPLDGSVWAAWTFADRAASDVAVSVLESSGSWSDPVLFESFDGLSQREPDVAIDAGGTVYVVYSVAQSEEIFLVARPPWTGEWSSPSRVSAPDESASAPILQVVGDRLVIAYRVGRGTNIVDLPLWEPPPVRTNGVQEGPDVIDPLGWTVGGTLPGSGD